MFVLESESPEEALFLGSLVAPGALSSGGGRLAHSGAGSPALDQEDIFTASQSEVFQPGNVLLYQSGLGLNIPYNFLLLSVCCPPTLAGVSSSSAREAGQAVEVQSKNGRPYPKCPSKLGKEPESGPCLFDFRV